MATVTYLGSTDKSVHDSGAVEIDDLVLEKDQPVDDVSDEQVGRLKDMTHHRFSFGDGEKLTGDALDARVKELGIDGASGMSADEKRAAIVEAEANS